MAEYQEQDKSLIYALDIGTRSVMGMVGRMEGGRFKVLDIETAEHDKRAMMDGQIDDIGQVAALVRSVTGNLERRMGVRLRRVCVAAAGRALRTQKGSFSLELPADKHIGSEEINQLETGAVTAAEEALQSDEAARRQFFLIGYTVVQYRLDNYPLKTLQFHNGGTADVDVVATFLPGEVIESLYATMRAAGLQVASLTLEPIASMNATIPADLRLLNLALVDIGAGTTDIAVCRDGSVIGYTMATVAGDEITEAIMRAFLVDFRTAERMKHEMASGEPVTYRDVLGMESEATVEEIGEAIRLPIERLAEAISKQVDEINGGAPSALFIAGGGSKLSGLCGLLAEELKMDPRRVALAGNNFEKSAFSDTVDLNNPEYATPLGIAVSAGMGLLNDSYVVTINGEPAKLFRNGILNLRDILLMNGYTYTDMIGRTGKGLNFTLDGRHIALRGELAVPAILRINDEDASLSDVIHAGDRIVFIPATQGRDASQTLEELLGCDFSGQVLVNNQKASLDRTLQSGDVVLTLSRDVPLPESVLRAEEPVSEEAPKEEPVPDPEPESAGSDEGFEAELEETEETEELEETEAPAVSAGEETKTTSADWAAGIPPVMPAAGKLLRVFLNDERLVLAPKADGTPYYVMDLLQYSGIDFAHLDREVKIEVNGQECRFQDRLKDEDYVTISCV